MSFQEFLKDNKNELLKNVIFLYGQEDLIIRWAMDAAIEQYLPASDRKMGVTEMDGTTSTLSDILAAASSYSMFAERRIVIVRNFLPLYQSKSGFDAKDQKALFDFIKPLVEQSLLIFRLDSIYEKQMTAFAKKLAKQAGSYRMERLKRPELEGFIQKRMNKGGKLLDRRTMDFLIDCSGYFTKESKYTLDELDRDLVKLLAVSEGDRIREAEVLEVILGDTERNVFVFIDALVHKDAREALLILRRIADKDKDELPRLLSLITGQFELMYDILEAEDAGIPRNALAKRLSMNEYRVKKAIRPAAYFGHVQLKEDLLRLYRIDRDLKTGDMDLRTSLELFVTEICAS